MKTTHPFWSRGWWEYEKAKNKTRQSQPKSENNTLFERILTNLKKFLEYSGPDKRVWGRSMGNDVFKQNSHPKTGHTDSDIQ
jgi:hypothetical protein